MKAMRRAMALLMALAVWLTAASAQAHVGSPNVFFDGQAGPYPVHVVVRPPDVVPGLAEISVRVVGDGVRHVSALPVFWSAGRKGAPPADEATPVPGDPSLYATRLWLMTPGAYSVDVAVEGTSGEGRVVVPVDSVALTRKPMEKWYGGMLLILAGLLLAAAISIVGATFREATLAPNLELSPARRRRAWIAMAVAAPLLLLVLAKGKAWWDWEDSDYRNNRLYRPLPATTQIRSEDGQSILRLSVQPPEDRHRGDWTPLLPDHGKLMHLFLIRLPHGDAYAHIHPLQRDRLTFDVAVPPLPAGQYQVYADVTHENGFAQTLVATAELPAPSATPPQKVSLAVDPDDSWHIDALDAPGMASQSQVSYPLSHGYTMVWESHGALQANREASLRFQVRDAQGKPATLQSYMGMMAHAALRREDGSVFTHLHPMGNISMAAQMYFGKNGADTKGVVLSCGPSSLTRAASTGEGGEISLPYEFPKPGAYRIWVQVKLDGRVETGVFDAQVADAGSIP